MNKYDYYLEEDYASKVYNDLQTRGWKPTFPTKANEVTLKSFSLNPKFKVGDRVRLNSGTAEIEVVKVSISQRATDYSYQCYIDGKYVNSDNVIYQRNQDDFVPYDGEKKMTNTNKLYTWKETYTALDGAAGFKGPDLYGHYLATNSQGEWVMEVKGSGQIMAVAKDKVQEVLPYTIGVRFNNNGTTYHYLADKDKFAEGFYLVKDTSSSGWQIARVVDVDTKSSKATVEFNPLGKLAVDLY